MICEVYVINEDYRYIFLNILHTFMNFAAFNDNGNNDYNELTSVVFV